MNGHVGSCKLDEAEQAHGFGSTHHDTKDRQDETHSRQFIAELGRYKWNVTGARHISTWLFVRFYASEPWSVASVKEPCAEQDHRRPPKKDRRLTASTACGCVGCAITCAVKCECVRSAATVLVCLRFLVTGQSCLVLENMTVTLGEGGQVVVQDLKVTGCESFPVKGYGSTS